MAPVRKRMPLRATLAEFERLIRDRYPDIHVADVAGHPGMRGSFPVVVDARTIDRFLIEVTFPNGADDLPRIEEIGGRIPKIADRHVYPDGQICSEVPELSLLRGYAFESYLDGPVRNYFIAQLSYEETGKWPFGEWDHGKPGLLQAYGGILGVTTEPEIRIRLEYLRHEHIKGHWPCICGNGKRLRDCHVEAVRTLHNAIPSRVAERALARLNLYNRRRPAA
jgi:hypothetical protein